MPFYAGLTLDEIGGRGIRWPERVTDWKPWETSAVEAPAPPPAAGGRLRLGTFRPLWAAKEVDASPILQFAIPRQVVELSPEDAAALGVREGDARRRWHQRHAGHAAPSSCARPCPPARCSWPRVWRTSPRTG